MPCFEDYKDVQSGLPIQFELVSHISSYKMLYQFIKVLCT